VVSAARCKLWHFCSTPVSRLTCSRDLGSPAHPDLIFVLMMESKYLNSAGLQEWNFSYFFLLNAIRLQDEAASYTKSRRVEGRALTLHLRTQEGQAQSLYSSLSFLLPRHGSAPAEFYQLSERDIRPQLYPKPCHTRASFRSMTVPEGAFNFDLCKRNSYLEGRGIKAPGFTKTGTTIAGIIFKVR